MEKISITPNSNFHFEGKKSILDSEDVKFKQYRSEWINNPREFKVRQFPLHLDIELTNICNLKCSYCASTHNKWGENKKGKMPFDLFKKIIDAGVENGLYSIKFSLRGESLLHENLTKMVSYARGKGIIDMYFNTNGVLLDENKTRELIEAGLNRISVSCDGWDKESFEKNRLGASFEIVYQNIVTLRKVREELNVDYPKIRIQAVMMPEIKAHWQEYLDLWRPLADEVGYLDARDEGPGVNHKGKKADWACPFLWQRMVILWDGTILPCLLHGVDDSSEMELGNVRDKDLKKEWLSAKMENFRKLHKQGVSHKLEACDKCSYRALEINKLVNGGL
ncbi:MAG: radical SAM/SPASM domain-containing protein [Candidatus Omnitrophota bacterium]